MLLLSEHFMWVLWLFPNLDHHYYYVYSALTACLVIIIIGFIVKSKLANVEQALIPSAKASLLNIVEVGVESLYGLVEDVLGHDAKKHMPFLGAVFIYVFVINIMGVIPGFHPATDNINTNLGVGVLVFLYYNYYGFKSNGIGYLKHFLGPIWAMAPLIAVIEIIGHCVRPLTLSVRLVGNITGDHAVLGQFSDMVPLLVPVVFMAFGIFVAFVQAFVFALLSTVYVGLATEHDH